MFRQRFAVDEIFHVSIRHLRYECMPAGDASIAGVKDVVFLPIRLGTKGPPRSRKQSRPNAAPTAIRQILEIEFAVVGIHRRLQRTDGVETLYELVHGWHIRRYVEK